MTWSRGAPLSLSPLFGVLTVTPLHTLFEVVDSKTLFPEVKSTRDIFYLFVCYC